MFHGHSGRREDERCRRSGNRECCPVTRAHMKLGLRHRARGRGDGMSASLADTLIRAGILRGEPAGELDVEATTKDSLVVRTEGRRWVRRRVSAA